MTSKKIYIALVLFLSLAATAQQKQVSTSIDTTKNKIGAQFNLVLKTTVDTTSAVAFPNQKLFGNLEVIRSYKIDTVKKADKYELIKRYGLTQFDSGRYTIPRLTVLINKKPFLTDSLSVEITNVAVDTLKQKMYDIKDIINTEKEPSRWWIYVLWLALIAGIGYLIYTLIKKRQVKKREELIYKTPIEKATTLLQQLEKKELWQKGEVKNYYSELTDIARNYIEEAIKIPAMESTTSELIAGLRMAAVKKNMKLTREIVENLEQVLRQADLVKFAKSKPLDFEIANDRKKIESTIVTLDQSMPEEQDDLSKINEAQKAKLIKKQRQKRIIITVGSVVFLLLISVIGLIAVKGTDFILGNSSKALAEGEWVKSDYGNPAITIETPEVLRRTPNSIVSTKDVALLKESQIFTYGNILGHLYITVATNIFAQPTDVDLSVVIEGNLKEWEAKGAGNILVKQEEFNTGQGISGVRAYGTLTMLDKINNSSKKMYYEMLYFKQDGGLQQVIVQHEEGDKYGQEILERIIKSVELQKLNQ